MVFSMAVSVLLAGVWLDPRRTPLSWRRRADGLLLLHKRIVVFAASVQAASAHCH